MTFRIRSLINLIVPQYSIFVIVSTLSAALIVNKSVSLSYFVAAIILSFAIFGLNSFNQIFDFHIDKKSKPKRPIPSGEITIKHAYVVSFIFFILAAISAIFININFSLIVLCFIVISIFYSMPPVRLKNHGIMSNIVGGTLYGIVPFLTAVVIGNVKNVQYFFLLLFFLFAFIISSIKDIEDLKVEKRVGIKTVPVLLGKEKTLVFVNYSVFFLLVITILLSFVSFIPRIFLYSSFVSFFALLLVTKKVKGENQLKNPTTQARIVSIYMLLILVIELLFGFGSYIA